MSGCNESNIIFQQHLCKLGQLQRSNGRNSQVFGQRNLRPPHFRTLCELVEGEENKLTTFSTWTIMLGCNESNIIFQQHLYKLGQLRRSNGRNSQVFGQAMKKRPTGHTLWPEKEIYGSLCLYDDVKVNRGSIISGSRDVFPSTWLGRESGYVEDCGQQDVPDAAASLREGSSRPGVEADRSVRPAEQERGLAGEIHPRKDPHCRERAADS